MFERYTEKARRVIHWGRYEAGQVGSECIGTEHILLGILQEDSVLTRRFFPSGNIVEAIREQIAAVKIPREKLMGQMDLPLSHESKRVLAYAAEEADKLSNRHLGTEHLLLGLLREETFLAATLLRERGISNKSVRDQLRAPGHNWQSKLLQRLESLPSQYGILAAASGIYVKPDCFPATKAFLYIEILSPTEPLWELQRRMAEHFARGLLYFWVLDPATRHVYIATPEAGLQEFKGDVLRTENPALELPLAEVFS
jgi:hypothetical protein